MSVKQKQVLKIFKMSQNCQIFLEKSNLRNSHTIYEIYLTPSDFTNPCPVPMTKKREEERDNARKDISCIHDNALQCYHSFLNFSFKIRIISNSLSQQYKSKRHRSK